MQKEATDALHRSHDIGLTKQAVEKSCGIRRNLSDTSKSLTFHGMWICASTDEGRRRRFQSDASGMSWIIMSPHTGHAPVAARLPSASRIVLPVNGRCSVQIMQ